MARVLPDPQLCAASFDEIPVLTDDALASSVGVRVLFTQRAGGFSTGPYASLNLATHVDDDLEVVMANRAKLAHAVGVSPDKVIVPNQVHGCDIVVISDGGDEALASVRDAAGEGADALIVETSDVAALLCFADCMPVIIVSPSGRFAVAHAGWRGALAGIAGKTVQALVNLDEAEGLKETARGMNVYIGPHIHVECFEVGDEVCSAFAQKYGNECVNGCCVNLIQAVSSDLTASGIDGGRIAIAPFCTQCSPDIYYSYRASGGICGRHGALAVRFA